MWRKASFKLASVAALCAALVAVIGLQAASASSRAALAGTAAPAKARGHRVGSISSSSPIAFQLVLKLRDAKGAASFARSVSTPGSSDFGHYLTAAQWEARYSPTSAAVAKARAWLKSQGFKVGSVSPDRTTISASGTAGQVERAFSTSLASYRVGKHTVRLASKDMSVPASLAGTIEGTLGVNQYVAKPHAVNYPPPPPAFIISKPCGAYYGAKTTTVKPPFGHGYPKKMPDVVCGYKPPQLRSAYGVKPTQTGQGYRVAIVDAYDSATIASDATTYFSKNDPSHPFSNAAFHRIDNAPFDQQSVCDAGGWLTEQAIDVEAVHGMATSAHIVYEGAKNCFDSALFPAEQDLIDHHRADVITNSWDDPSGDVLDDSATRAAYDDIFMMADSTGISVMFSSGDDGDNFDLTGIAAPGYPDSSPYVTAVGGTTLKINAHNQRTGELGWATGRAFFCSKNAVGILCSKKQVGHWLPASEDGVSGGYTSYNYAQPSYQKGIVPKSLAQRNSPIIGPQCGGHNCNMRVTPDVSLDADPGTGFLIGLTQTFKNSAHYSQTRYGGTSLASPLLAGVIADADQVGHKAIGFINPAMYGRSKIKASTIMDILPEKGLQANYRVDHAGQIVPGVKGFFRSVRELYFKGPEVYCDGTGNCAKRPNTLSAAKGFDSLTGLGSPGSGFITNLAGS
jgi:subtilase family serine protease